MVYADFHNADPQGRFFLICVGTVEDLCRQGIELCEGLRLSLYADDLGAPGQLDELRVDGITTYSAEERCWVAMIDWTAIRPASDRQTPRPIGASQTS